MAGICEPCKVQNHKHCDDIDFATFTTKEGRLYRSCNCQHKEGKWENLYDIPAVEHAGPTRDSKAGESFDG